jgi:hypothetical protein
LPIGTPQRLRVGHEQIELVGPEEVDLRAESGHPCRVDGVEALSPLLAGGDETGLLENQEVLRDGRTCHREGAGEVGHGAWTGGQQLQQASPSGLGRCSEGVDHERYVSCD